MDRVSDILVGHRILQFSSENRYAIEEEGKIKAPVVVSSTVRELPDDQEEIAPVESSGFFIETACRANVDKLGPATQTPDSIAQHFNSASPSNLSRQMFQELRFDLCAVMRAKSLPLLELCCQRKVRDITGNEAESPVVVLPASLLICAECPMPVQMLHAWRRDCGIRAFPKQAGLNGFLESSLRYLYDQTVSRPMILMVRARTERAGFSASHRVSHLMLSPMQT